jgi:hypothetical protein
MQQQEEEEKEKEKQQRQQQKEVEERGPMELTLWQTLMDRKWPADLTYAEIEELEDMYFDKLTKLCVAMKRCLRETPDLPNLVEPSTAVYVDVAHSVLLQGSKFLAQKFEEGPWENGLQRYLFRRDYRLHLDAIAGLNRPSWDSMRATFFYAQDNKRMKRLSDALAF